MRITFAVSHGRSAFTAHVLPMRHWHARWKYFRTVFYLEPDRPKPWVPRQQVIIHLCFFRVDIVFGTIQQPADYDK